MRARQLRRRIAAAAGLLAMLLQLCVSLGHMHAGDLARAVTLQASGCATPADCSRHIPPGLPDDACPICAAVHMASSGIPPTVPTIIIPAEFITRIHRPFVVAFHRTDRRHSPFQTRAPPLA